MMDLTPLLEQLIDRGGSDLHLQPGDPPVIRVQGELIPLDGNRLSREDTQAAFEAISAARIREDYSRDGAADFAHELPGRARFRVNAFRERGDLAMVFRHIPVEIPAFETLGLPDTLLKIAMEPRGLVLVVGVTGSGKSTTLAAMINEVNEKLPVHVITVEDPLEFVHQDKTAIITQREVGHDTLSFANALRGALRQDPDVILIGEMRDAETVRTALASAETGHLVFSTLHTVDAVETLNRIIDFFEPHQQLQIRKQLASVLRAVVSQRIVPLASATGRCVAAEILVGNRTIREFIEQGKSFKDIVKLIEEGHDQYGMQTFDQALYDLYKAGKITAEIALMNATSAKDLKLRLQGLRVN